MSTTGSSTPPKPPITRFVLGGLIAGIAAAVVNNIYHMIYSSATGISIPQYVNVGSVTGGSVILLLVASIAYFVLSRFTAKAKLIFVAGTLILTVVSFAAPLGSTLPDGTPTPEGFAGITLPMHIIAGLAAVVLIPRFADKR